METDLTNLESPSPETVTVLPNTPAKVEFTPEQQAVFDRVLKESHSRIAKQEREENARLKLENQRLKEVAAGQGSADELEKARAEAASARLEAQATLERSIQQQRDLLIAQESSKNDFVDTSVVQALTRQNLRHDPATGGFTVLNDDGTPRLNAAGEPMPVSEFYQQFRDSKPFLVRGRTIFGTGQGSSQGASIPASKPLEYYFGPQSNAAAANRLAIERPDEYRRKRIEAQRKGLVG